MSRREGQDVSEESRRPLLADAPEWFNRARAQTRQRPVFQPLVYQPQPVPLPQSPPIRQAALASRWERPRKALRYGLCATVAPVVFALGFWARGVVSPENRELASDRAGGSAALHPVDRQDVPARQEQASPPAEREQRQGFAPPRPPPADRQEFAAVEPPAPVGDRSRPMTSPGGPDQQESGAPGTRALAANNLHSWGLSSESEKQSNPSGGFSLRTAREVRQVSAEVVGPVRAWFASATNDDQCATGTCPAPVARLDSKLNTGLEWSSTPEVAAQTAQREGKLVFLIHVSGNFAQPGFT